MSGRGHGTRSKTMRRSERPGTSMPSRTASVPSRQESSSARKMSIKVAVSMPSTCWADSGTRGQQRQNFRPERRGDALIHRLEARDRGEEAERAATRSQEEGTIGGG